MDVLIPELINNASDEQLAAVYRWPSHEQGSASGQPWVRANFAATIDGAITDSNGLSAGVSSADDKRVFALLRATCDAVVVGAGTARAEGYGPVRVRESMATVRRASGRAAPPRLVIISGSANLDPASSMFTETESGARTIVLTRQQAPSDNVSRLSLVADVVVCGDADVDLQACIDHLASLGLTRLVCEGGPTLFGDLLTARLIDDLCLTTSPLISSTPSESREALIGHHGIRDSTPATLGSLVRAGNSLLARWLFTKDLR